MKKIFYIFLGLVLLASCSKNPLPPDCRDLRGFLDVQTQKIQEMRIAIDGPEGGGFIKSKKLANSLLLTQDKILNLCQAEIVARGMDCRQAGQASIVSNTRMNMRSLVSITDREYKTLGRRYVGELLKNAAESANSEVSGDLCK